MMKQICGDVMNNDSANIRHSPECVEILSGSGGTPKFRVYVVCFIHGTGGHRSCHRFYLLDREEARKMAEWVKGEVYWEARGCACFADYHCVSTSHGHFAKRQRMTDSDGMPFSAEKRSTQLRRAAYCGHCKTEHYGIGNNEGHPGFLVRPKKVKA